MSPASVVFTAADWSSSQTVTVTGVADSDADGNVAYTIVTAAASSTDSGYSNRAAADVSVTNNDLRTLHAAIVAGVLTVSGNDDNGTEGDDYTFGAAAVDKFFRFFGDSNGDRNVNTTDLTLFRKALGKSELQAGYQWYFDFDDDGDVDSGVDYTEFLARYLGPAGGRPTWRKPKPSWSGCGRNWPPCGSGTRRAGSPGPFPAPSSPET